MLQYSSKKIFLIATLAALAYASTALPVSAQALATQQPAPVQYIVGPENPGPNAPVYIEAQGIGNFLGNANITWTENGKVVTSGAGVRTFSFTTGAIGTQTIIGFSADTASYGTITHTFSFNPSLINLVWEANTTFPPFYRGKALATPGASVRVVAFPNVIAGGAAKSASGLSFQWSLDGVADPAQSGMGRSVFTLNANQLHSNADVAVNVILDNATVGRGEIVIPFSQPQIVFYVHDPLRGVLYNQALGATFAMPTQEETLRAEPYFFSPSSFVDGGLTYAWQLNGADTTGPDTANGELTLRQSGAGAGTANISVSLQNTDADKLLQAAQAALSITFGGQSSSSFFGL